MNFLTKEVSLTSTQISPIRIDIEKLTDKPRKHKERKERNVERVIISRNVLAIKITKTCNIQKHNILLIGIYVNGNDNIERKKEYAEMINMFINIHKDDYDQILFVGDFNVGFIFFQDKVPVCLYRNNYGYDYSMWLYKCFEGILETFGPILTFQQGRTKV
jgi:hypothetical protein